SRFTPGPLKNIAADTGGHYYGASSSGALQGVYATIANELKRTWRLDYVTNAQPGEHLNLRVSAPGQGSAGAQLSIPAGALPGAGGGSSLPGAAFALWGRVVLALSVALLVLVACVISTSTRQGDRLRDRLAPHVGRAFRRAGQKRSGRERLEALNGLFRLTEQ